MIKGGRHILRVFVTLHLESLKQKKRNTKSRYNYLVLGRDQSYFVDGRKTLCDSSNRYSETDITKHA